VLGVSEEAFSSSSTDSVVLRPTPEPAERVGFVYPVEYVVTVGELAICVTASHNVSSAPHVGVSAENVTVAVEPVADIVSAAP
jgi:hypothetical protein